MHNYQFREHISNILLIIKHIKNIFHIFLKSDFGTLETF